MKLEKELYDRVVENAAALLSVRQIALAVGLDVKEALKAYADRENDFYLAVQQGVLQTMAANNLRVIQDAKNGSGPAQVEVFKLYEKFRINEEMDGEEEN